MRSSVRKNVPLIRIAVLSVSIKELSVVRIEVTVFRRYQQEKEA